MSKETEQTPATQETAGVPAELSPEERTKLEA